MTKQPTILRYREGIYTRNQYIGGMPPAEIEAEIVALLNRGIEAWTIEVL